MSEQSSISKKSEKSARTARTVAAILSQTANDEALRALDQSDGRNQSEQASFIDAQSPFLRDIYERGGSVKDGVLTVPKEILTQSPEIEITTTRQAVERLTRITKNSSLAKELAPQLVEMGERIAGSHADGETRLKVFRWLYRYLEGKQELLEPKSTEKDADDLSIQSEAEFSEKWRQIVELSEAMAALEPKDRMPENSLEALSENIEEAENAFERDENSNAEVYEAEMEIEGAQHAEEFVSGIGLIGFERIEVGTDLPRIPENLSRPDFEKLLEMTPIIDSQLERGVKSHEVLAPFKRYVELTRLDNELRLVEEEFVNVQAKTIDGEKGASHNYRFVAKSEELRELAGDRRTLDALRAQKVKVGENIQTNFGENIDRAKVERSIPGRNITPDQNFQSDAAKPEKIELTEDETELRELLLKEKSVEREIVELSESIGERENNFRAAGELAAEEISSARKNELIEKVVAMELPNSAVLKEKYSELTARQRDEKLNKANTLEIRNAAEYLFVKDAATRQFQALQTREIRKEFQKFEGKNITENAADGKAARYDLDKHRERIQSLRNLEPVFAYKIEGSNRIIKAKPSERAVAGYKFAADYVRYQLKQPETRLRHESGVYREFALRLEAAKTAQDVIGEAYLIRQENHRHAGLWKNAEKSERNKLQRPLSKNEMTLLFLEQPPKNYTAEMSVLKYNFAHYSEAKQRMTAALEEGNLQPSDKAKKLVESLEARLIRRDLDTKHKATKHFFESLKTENEKLVIKNEFDHAHVYRNLPPHEKDWIYRRAQEQKGNLEYKTAYEREKNAARNINLPDAQLPTNEAAARIKQEFAAGTLWHQATILTGQNAPNNSAPVAFADDKVLQAVGFLIHNQTEANNLRVAEWLENQKSEEMKTAGEILKTFAGAKREIENDRLTVTVKIAETDKVSINDYKTLFERYFPADFEKLKEFRVNENEKFRLEQSRRSGQTAMLNSWEKDAQRVIYREGAPVKVFENERRERQEIESIKAVQIECRRAVESKNALLGKYEEKLKKEFAKNNKEVSAENLRAAVEYSFAPEKSKTFAPEQKAIFERAQDKVLISDFERFTTSAKLLEKGIVEINQSFEKIAALRLENEPYKLTPEKTEKIESLQNQYETMQRRAEAEQITIIARDKFAVKTIDENIGSATLEQLLSDEERRTARVESHRQARIALEPAELSELGQNSKIKSKALEFADALEDAHQKSLRDETKSEIAEAFAVAETKREQIREFLKIEKETQLSPEKKPVTLLIYERELARNEKAITRAKINEMIETGKLSLADLETKKASEIFSPQERASIRLEAGERTRENLEPKELWASRRDVSEKLQQTALNASDALEQAHEIYHQSANPKEVSRAFSALDTSIVRLKNERREARLNSKFINFKTDFKRDLAQMFEGGKPVENTQVLAAMTKGLLLDALEKQNVQPEKIGLTGEKLSEISRTITLAMVDDRKREKMFAVNHKSAAMPVQDSHAPHTKNASENQQTPDKTRQFEHIR